MLKTEYHELLFNAFMTNNATYEITIQELMNKYDLKKEHLKNITIKYFYTHEKDMSIDEVMSYKKRVEDYFHDLSVDKKLLRRLLYEELMHGDNYVEMVEQFSKQYGVNKKMVSDYAKKYFYENIARLNHDEYLEALKYNEKKISIKYINDKKQLWKETMDIDTEIIDNYVESCIKDINKGYIENSIGVASVASKFERAVRGEIFKENEIIEEIIIADEEQLKKLIKKYNASCLYLALASYKIIMQKCNIQEIENKIKYGIELVRKDNKIIREQKNREKELKLLPRAKEIILDYIDSKEKTIPIYCEKNVVDELVFRRSIDIVKKYDSETYNKYSEIAQSHKGQGFAAICGSAIAFAKKVNENIDKYDILDYYLETTFEPEFLLKILNTVGRTILARKMYSFFQKNAKIHRIDEDIARNMEIKSATMKEKNVAIDFLLDNNIPLSIETISLGINRYKKGELVMRYTNLVKKA